MQGYAIIDLSDTAHSRRDGNLERIVRIRSRRVESRRAVREEEYVLPFTAL